MITVQQQQQQQVPMTASARQPAMGLGTVLPSNVMAQNTQHKTSNIYSLIRDQKYAAAVRLLQVELQTYPTSRAALSLLGHCYYHMQEFVEASRVYELLVQYHTDVAEYKVYHAQSLFQAGMYDAALKACQRVDDPQFYHRMLHLKASIKYEQNDLVATKAFIDKCLPDDPNTLVANGCLCFKEGDYDGARQKFQEAMNSVGYQSDLAYDLVACYYKKQDYGEALRYIDEIIERGAREHPELSIGAREDGRAAAASVGNSQTLKQTALIEAFNAKAAIEFQLKNYDAARRALVDMPPRDDEELDSVTLMNQALMNMDTDPTAGFKKLNFLLAQETFPAETFGNLLLLYCQYQYYDIAADLLAEQSHLIQSCLSQDLYEYLDATILSQSQPRESFRKFEILSKKHVDTLRKLTKKITDARVQRDAEATQLAIQEYNEALERYIPVLMAQTKIYWDRENYGLVERTFRQSFEFCSEHDVWKLNVAHVFFMQENKYTDAIRYYEPIVRANIQDLLEVQAIVLANLCVAYIMTSQNEQAEDLMRQIETQEETANFEEPNKQYFHLCIVNLVIGTLYCAKGNYEFGISRIMTSLQPYDRKLGTDTWYYAKRCLLAMLEGMAKQMLVFRDQFLDDVFVFLRQAEAHGKHIVTRLNQPGIEVDPLTDNVAHESRLIQRLLLKVRA